MKFGHLLELESDDLKNFENFLNIQVGILDVDCQDLMVTVASPNLYVEDYDGPLLLVNSCQSMMDLNHYELTVHSLMVLVLMSTPDNPVLLTNS